VLVLAARPATQLDRCEIAAEEALARLPFVLDRDLSRPQNRALAALCQQPGLDRSEIAAD